MSAVCELEVQKLLGRELSDAERKELNDEISGLVERLSSEQSHEALDARVRKAIDARAEEIQLAALVEKRNAVKNTRARINNTNYIKNVWGDDPIEGFKAVLGESLADRQGSRTGLANRVHSVRDYYMSSFMSRLQKAGISDVAASGKLDRDVWRAMAALDGKDTDRAILNSIPKDAIEYAKIIKQMNELARQEANKSGAWIKKMDGYVIRRSHDADKLGKAAGAAEPITSPKHKEAWVSYVEERIDWERTMPDVPVQNRTKVLGKMYQSLRNGVHTKAGGKPVSGLKGFANIGKGMSHERVLHFKTPDADFEYNAKFGSGNNLAEDVMNGLKRVGTETGFMQKLGPNAEMNLDAIYEATLNRLNKAEANPETIAKFKSYYANEVKKQFLPSIKGELDIPANNVLATAGSVVRAINSASMLGSSVLSGFGDIPMYGLTMRYINGRTHSDMFEGMRQAMGDLFGGFKGKPTVEQMEILAEFGVHQDTVNASIARFDVGDKDVPGQMSKLLGWSFKMNGLTWWQDTLRRSSVITTAFRHAQHVTKTMGELPEGMQAILRQFDIEDGDWDLIRATKLAEYSEGRSVLTPEGVADLSDDVIDSRLKQLGKKITKSSRTNFKNELTQKYRMLFREVGAMATTEPGELEKAMVNMGSQRGTAKGEAIRSMMQFKSFMLTSARKHLGRELHGYHSQRVSAPEALKRLMTDDRGGKAALANLMAWSTVFGYAAMTAKDLTKGKEPRIPTDAKSFVKISTASMLQSGALGIYGDFIFGDANRFGGSPIATLAGPTAGKAEEVLKLWSAATRGDPIAAKTLNFAINNTPVLSTATNLFYTRAAFDYLFMHRMREMMNPGYLKRMERRIKSENDQEFIVPPSKVIPRGGF